MARKVEIAYIASDSARRAAYKKRKKGLLKKAGELATLCGVETCAIIHSAYESSPVVWPDREQGQRAVEHLRRMPEMDQKRKMYDHPAYLRLRIEKAARELKRVQRDKRWMEVAVALRGCLNGELTVEGMKMEDLSELGWLIDVNLEQINRRLRCLDQQPPQLLQMLPAAETAMGPMGRLLLGMESDEVESSIWAAERCNQVAPEGLGGASA